MTQIAIDIYAEALLDRGCGALLRGRLSASVRPGMTALALPAQCLPLLTARGLRPQQAGQLLLEVRAGLGEWHPVLRPPGPGHAGLDGREIEMCGLRVFG